MDNTLVDKIKAHDTARGVYTGSRLSGGKCICGEILVEDTGVIVVWADIQEAWYEHLARAVERWYDERQREYNKTWLERYGQYG